MTERALDPLLLAETEGRQLTPIILAEFLFDSGALRLWSGTGEITIDGDLFTGSGTLGEIGTIEETTEVRATGTSFKISGISSDAIALALAEPYQGRPMTCWFSALDDDDQPIGTRYRAFRGYMDGMEIEDAGDTCSIEIAVENQLIDLERLRECRYTDADQRSVFPGDKGLEFVNPIRAATLAWGAAGTGTD